jgi:hypothetical protein
MNSEESYTWRKQVVWGLLLITVGAVVLLHQLSYLDAGAFWHYWPLLLVVVGLNQLIGSLRPQEFGSGLWTIFIGLWLFACFEHLFGLTFRNSWPLLIFAVGVKMVAEPLFARRLALTHREHRNEK